MSCVIFKSLSHFEFIFVGGVRVCSDFTDLHVAVHLYEYHLLKTVFSLCFLSPLWKTS